MAKTYAFDRASARRIARAVLNSERTQVPPGSRQRRRGGGLGRLSLWEVTAVNTGAETCTLERVEDQDFNLITRSEREDVLYDPDSEPAIGDRGLVVWLGEGSLFFFRRAPATRVFCDHHLYVKTDAPSSSFGDPTDCTNYTLGENATTWHGVVKFEKQVVFAPTFPARGIFHLADAPDGLEMSAGPKASTWFKYFVQLYAIVESSLKR